MKSCNPDMQSMIPTIREIETLTKEFFLSVFAARDGQDIRFGRQGRLVQNVCVK